MSVDFCPQFLYFILNYLFLVFNSTRVGISILSNFTNSFNHFVNQILDLSDGLEMWRIIIFGTRYGGTCAVNTNIIM